MRALAMGLITMLSLLACGGEEDDDLSASLEQSVSGLPGPTLANPSPYPSPNDDPVPGTKPTPSGKCGDGLCSKASGETMLTCPKDCAPVGDDKPFCGDGTCSSSAGESCASCAKDCGSCCGNGKCDYGESCSSCPKDCGSCCGNGTCDASESAVTCPSDCGGSPTTCGNGRWDPGEGCDWVGGQIRAGVFGGPVTWGPSCNDFAIAGTPYCGGTLRCVGCKFVVTGCRLSEGPCFTAGGDYGCLIDGACIGY